jgi:hypothetical protein
MGATLRIIGMGATFTIAPLLLHGCHIMGATDHNLTTWVFFSVVMLGRDQWQP